MAMIQMWRGLPPTEAAFHQNASPKGHDLELASELGRVRVRVLGLDEVSEIDLALRLGRLVIATVFGPPYVTWFAKSHPKARSRHGPLCAPGTRGGPVHSILLIARNSERYAVHDPWYPAAGQPFWMPEEAFQHCFACRIAVAEP